MKKHHLLAILFACFSGISLGQAPYLVNYQAVAHDATGALLTNQSVTVTFGIYRGSATGTLVWEEDHTLSTNDYGLFYTRIGAGSGTGAGSLGAFSSIGWGIDSYYLKTQIDAGSGPQDLGTVQFVSVPYALNAGSTGAINNQLVNSAGAVDGNILVFNGTSGAWEILPSSALFNAGAGIDITSGVITNTGDVDGSDDYITGFGLNATSDSVFIQDANGRYVIALSDINSPGVDADGDGWPVNLDLDDTDAAVTFHDADNDPANEYNVSFGLNAGSDSLVLTDNGGSLAVPLTAFSDGDWTVSGTDVYNTSGNIGIGTSTPGFPLELRATAQRGAYIEIDGFSSSSYQIGVSGIVTNAGGSGDNIGGTFNAIGGTGGNNIGLEGIASGGVGINYGIFAQASGGSLGNYAGYFNQGDVYIADHLGIGTTTPAAKLDVEGDVQIDGEYTYETIRTRYQQIPISALSMKKNPNSGGGSGFEFDSYVFGFFGESAYCYFTGGSGVDAVATAPVYLPDGAIVTNLEAKWYDLDASADVSLSLERVSWATINNEEMAIVNSSGSSTATSGMVIGSDSGITSATIDNNNYSYYVKMASIEGANCGISKIRITYTVTNAD
ncbi:MAG: hypothetical protein CL833_11790 [Crocinitomicaceae bacterium]|nr:hypothetical protein [Crocinitomicaceae bacterium]